MRTTSAPKPAKSFVQYAPAMPSAKSTTRTPASACSIPSPLVVRFR